MNVEQQRRYNKLIWDWEFDSIQSYLAWLKSKGCKTKIDVILLATLLAKRQEIEELRALHGCERKD